MTGSFLNLKNIMSNSIVHSLQYIAYRRSRDNMGKTLNHLQIMLRRTPEQETEARQRLMGKIEALKIIRYEMKILLRQLR